MDEDPSLEAAAVHEPEARAIAPAFDWDAVPLPAVPTGSDLRIEAPPSPDQVPALGSWNIEHFYMDSSEFFSLSMAPGGLFAPIPAGGETMPPELESGFFLGFRFRDQDNNLVGFASEQEILDFEALTSKTTYTLTFAERGTLFFKEREDFAYVIEAAEDMLASDELIRSFDPPLVTVHTIPGTGRIVGGTGEFHGAKGFVREIGIVYELDLTTGRHHVGTILQIAWH